MWPCAGEDFESAANVDESTVEAVSEIQLDWSDFDEDISEYLEHCLLLSVHIFNGGV